MLTIIILYVIGYAAAYFGYKRFLDADKSNWTKQDKAIALTLAVSSWIGIILCGLSYLWTKVVSEKPAKW